jgi:hypothetical protein
MGHVQPDKGLGVGTDDAGGVDVEDEDALEDAAVRGGMVFGFLGADSVTRRLTCRASGRVPRENVGGLALDEEELSALTGFCGLTTPPPFPVGFAGVAGMY